MSYGVRVNCRWGQGHTSQGHVTPCHVLVIAGDIFIASSDQLEKVQPPSRLWCLAGSWRVTSIGFFAKLRSSSLF